MSDWKPNDEALLRVTIEDVHPGEGSVTIKIEGTDPGPAYANLREPASTLTPTKDARIAELEAKVARVEALVRDAERTYALSAHKPNINYELGFIDLMRFIRTALKGNSDD